jgi:hypothetical protein
MAETTKIKFIRGVHYKGAEFKAGSTAEVEPAIAERIVAEGNAEVVTEKAGEKERDRRKVLVT